MINGSHRGSDIVKDSKLLLIQRLGMLEEVL